MAFLNDENWLNDLAFLTDITQHLSELKLKLQWKIQLVNKLLEHICAFEKIFELFQVQVSSATLINFMCLAARKMEIHDLHSTNYAASAHKLCDEFTSRFTELRPDEIKAKLLAHPFDLLVEDSPDD